MASDVLEEASTFMEHTKRLLTKSREKKDKKTHPIKKYRPGIIGTKVGMTTIFDTLGIMHPISLVHVNLFVNYILKINASFLNFLLIKF